MALWARQEKKTEVKIKIKDRESVCYTLQDLQAWRKGASVVSVVSRVQATEHKEKMSLLIKNEPIISAN